MRRAQIYKCPNHLECLTGYHGDDVEIAPDMPLVCPECGTPLAPLRSPRRGIPDWMINLLSLATLITVLWFAWPHVQRVWEKATSPGTPGRTR